MLVIWLVGLRQFGNLAMPASSTLVWAGRLGWESYEGLVSHSGWLVGRWLASELNAAVVV
jgi:hypothetical protein